MPIIDVNHWLAFHREWGQRVGKAKTRSYHFMEQVCLKLFEKHNYIISYYTSTGNKQKHFMDQNGMNMVLWRMEVEPHDRDDQVPKRTRECRL